MPGPLFTLLTDFGAGSGYPAEMKAVLLSAVPDARIVDVSHEVPRHDVLAAALLLERCVPPFPREAIHIAVVDPGVGSVRRALAVEDGEGRRFIAPDNGLLTPLLAPGARVREIVPGLALPAPASATFHGRDLFAPAAAFLARGGTLDGLGPAVSDPARLDWPDGRVRGNEASGATLSADPFGNLVTSIRVAALGGRAVRGAWAAERPARWVRTFADGAPGELVAYAGSGGRVEIAVREGSAAERLGGVLGFPVRLVLGDGA